MAMHRTPMKNPLSLILLRLLTIILHCVDFNEAHRVVDDSGRLTLADPLRYKQHLMVSERSHKFYLKQLAELQPRQMGVHVDEAITHMVLARKQDPRLHQMKSDVERKALVDKVIQLHRIRHLVASRQDQRQPPRADHTCLSGGPHLPRGGPRIYIINLKKRADRRNWMEQVGVPPKLHPQVIWWPAMDGLMVSQQWLLKNNCTVLTTWALPPFHPRLNLIPGFRYASHIPYHHNTHFYTRAVRPGELGLTLTHIDIWRDIVKSQEEFAIVFEDDVAISAEGTCVFSRALERLKLRNYGWHIAYADTGIWLGDAQDASDNGELGDDWARLGFTYSAWAVAISRAGAQWLLDLGVERCLAPIDEILPFLSQPHGHPRYEELSSCLRWPPCAHGTQGEKRQCLDLDPSVLSHGKGDFVAIRWRGWAVVVDHARLPSDIDMSMTS